MTGRSHSENRQRTELICVRLLPAEHAALKREAGRLDVSMGELVRQRLDDVIGAAK